MRTMIEDTLVDYADNHQNIATIITSADDSKTQVQGIVMGTVYVSVDHHENNLEPSCNHRQYHIPCTYRKQDVIDKLNQIANTTVHDMFIMTGSNVVTMNTIHHDIVQSIRSTI